MSLVVFQPLLHFSSLKITKEIDDFLERKLKHLSRINTVVTEKAEIGWKITWKHAECNTVPYWLGHLAALLNCDARTRQNLAGSINYGIQKLMYMPPRSIRQIQINGPELPLP